MRCGNVWSCTKVVGVREKQIRALFEGVLGANDSAVMVTFTASHIADDSLADLLFRFKKAQWEMGRSRDYRRLIQARAGAIVVGCVVRSHLFQRWARQPAGSGSSGVAAAAVAIADGRVLA